jgi:hypothetical protein
MEVTTTGPAEARTIPSLLLSQTIPPRASRLQDPPMATRARLLGATVVAEAEAVLVNMDRRTMIGTTPMATSVGGASRRRLLMSALCCSIAMIRLSTPMVSQMALIAS